MLYISIGKESLEKERIRINRNLNNPNKLTTYFKAKNNSNGSYNCLKKIYMA